MQKHIQEYLRSAALGVGEPHEQVKVLVELSVADLGTDGLDELRAIGLSIDEVIHNKILGSIMASEIEALRSHRFVTEVELSHKLKLHTHR